MTDLKALSEWAKRRAFECSLGNPTESARYAAAAEAFNRSGQLAELTGEGETPRTDFVAHESGDAEWDRFPNRFGRMMAHAQVLERELVELTGEGETPRTDSQVTGNSEATQDEYIELADFARTLERELAAEKERADAAIASWDEERGRAQREGERVIASLPVIEAAEEAVGRIRYGVSREMGSDVVKILDTALAKLREG